MHLDLNKYTYIHHFIQFLSKVTSDSTTFKVTMSHFVFYPCRALMLDKHKNNAGTAENPARPKNCNAAYIKRLQ